jgi:hypothetical protein
MTTKSTKNPAAVALGKLGAGKPKNYSAEELKRRTERLKAARKSILVIALAASVALTGNLNADDLGRFIAEIKTDQALAGTDAETVRLQHDAEMVKDMERRDQEIRADHAAYNEHLMKWVTDNQDKFAAERLAKAKAAQAEIDARQAAIDKGLDRALSVSAIRANDAYSNWMSSHP